MAEAERYVLESKNLKMFLKEDFLEKIESEGEIFPVSIVFISKEKDKEKNVQINPIIFNHQNDKEIEGNILHVDSNNTKLLKKIVTKLEKNGK